MNERNMLLESICREPLDPLPKLVLADWLEERDKEGHAALRWAAKHAKYPVYDDEYPESYNWIFYGNGCCSLPLEPSLLARFDFSGRGVKFSTREGIRESHRRAWRWLMGAYREPYFMPSYRPRNYIPFRTIDPGFYDR